MPFRIAACSLCPMLVSLLPFGQPSSSLVSCESFTGRSANNCQRSVRALEAEHGGCDRDSEANTRLARVGAKLVRQVEDLPVSCNFRLLNETARNAYSLSCGYIYVTRGLYKELATDDLLAAALAHELAHVAAQDGRRPCDSSGCHVEKEVRADRRAAGYLHGAGYKPARLVSLVRLLKSEQPSGWAEKRESAVTTEVQRLRDLDDARLADSSAAVSQ